MCLFSFSKVTIPKVLASRRSSTIWLMNSSYRCSLNSRPFSPFSLFERPGLSACILPCDHTLGCWKIHGIDGPCWAKGTPSSCSGSWCYVPAGQRVPFVGHIHSLCCYWVPNCLFPQWLRYSLDFTSTSWKQQLNKSLPDCHQRQRWDTQRERQDPRASPGLGGGSREGGRWARGWSYSFLTFGISDEFLTSKVKISRKSY